MSSITTEESNEALAVAIVRAINENQITVDFDIHGRIIAYNEKFIILMDCSREELVDKCNSDFVDPKSKSASDYSKFWDALRSGQSFTGEFELIAKNGRRIWLFANYTPVLGLDGNVQRVIMIASDITSSKETSIANSGIRDAIERSMAVIEFTPDGTIKRANDLFCAIMDYSEDEIRGSHHKIFLNAEEAQSLSYQQFWKRLASGEVMSGQFERISKNGNSVWLEATYNPILNLNKEVVRVIKFSTDVTEKVQNSLRVTENSKQLEAALQHAIESDKKRQELDQTVQEMSTPVTPIWQDILLLPLVGVVDSTRTDDVMRKSLAKISETEARIFILDISGVPMVDNAVANQLIKITKATRLMGCETIISGLSPSIAQTMVDLGVEVGQIRTTATLRDALKAGLRSVSAANRHWSDPGIDLTSKDPNSGQTDL
jgi:methyl-accepting chemotaxis protein